MPDQDVHLICDDYSKNKYPKAARLDRRRSIDSVQA
jgi:hypothetical protein